MENDKLKMENCECKQSPVFVIFHLSFLIGLERDFFIGERWGIMPDVRQMSHRNAMFAPLLS